MFNQSVLSKLNLHIPFGRIAGSSRRKGFVLFIYHHLNATTGPNVNGMGLLGGHTSSVCRLLQSVFSATIDPFVSTLCATR